MISTDQFADLPQFSEMCPAWARVLSRHLHRGGTVALFLDVDGCLSMDRLDAGRDFPVEPDNTVLRAEAVAAIDTACRTAGIRCHVVSGRTAADLDRICKDLPDDVELDASYGAMKRHKGVWECDATLNDPSSHAVLQTACTTYEAAVFALLRERRGDVHRDELIRRSGPKAEAIDAIWAPMKEASVAYHFTDHRGVVMTDVRDAMRDALRKVEDALDERLTIALHNGNVELGWAFDKAAIMHSILEDEFAWVVQLGDDHGDVAAMHLLSASDRGFAVAVQQGGEDGRSGSPGALATQADAVAIGAADASSALYALTSAVSKSVGSVA